MGLRHDERSRKRLQRDPHTRTIYMVIVGLVILAFVRQIMNSFLILGDGGTLNRQNLISSMHTGDSTLTSPPTCSHEQLMVVRHQLPPELCLQAIQQPWTQKCSFTTATKCPKATWLDHHYLELQKRYLSSFSSSGGGTTRNLNPQESPPSSSFLGISIGCNKGFDAINTLRMGTFDGSIDKKDWKSAMEQDGVELHKSVCNQDDPQDVFEVAKDFQQQSARPHGEMHCVEPMPQTFKRLNHSAEVLGYDKKGLTVTHAAVSKESGEMLFQTGGMKEGVENMGLGSCTNLPILVRKQVCQSVPVYSLRDFVQQHVKAEKADPINILSIDVEGFDGDVLLGATPDVLERVEYLEFEYNWMGSWTNQHLYDITQMLSETAHMTCYWAGVDRLWRITNCWMSYFDLHAWSNVACVNRKLVPSMASHMEETFGRTLLETDMQWIKEGLNQQHLAVAREQFKDHELLSTEPEHLAKKYHANN